MRFILEDRFALEEGAYRAYVTDEKMNIDKKDDQIYETFGFENR